MGTLTANQTRLPEYCEHKLPTSCRLSSITNCCACADERAHAASYSTYIDGIGFVLRGTRWQRYCWFCKEFWAERVRVSGLRSGQTKIPENPDQTDFLRKWYEFHQGYRIVLKEDGSEERVAVLGEDFKDVSPGCLPRTLEELRSGRRAEDAPQAPNAAAQIEQENGPSLDETLEQMFAAASTEVADQAAQSSAAATRTSQPPNGIVPGAAPAATNIHAQAMNPAGSRNREYQMRRVAALRRELNRMRNGIERVITGLRDLGEDVPNEIETTGRLTALGDTLDTINGSTSQEEAQNAINTVNELARSASAANSTDNTLAQIQARVDDARAAMEEARRARDQAASEFDYAEQEFRTSQHRFHQVQREQRSTENYLRIFGTREEVIAQGENYVSPIGNMFSRAEERFRVAEEVRREERTLRQVLEDEARSNEDVMSRLTELGERRRDVWGVPHPERAQPGALDSSVDTTVPSETPPTLIPTAEESQLEQYYAMLRRQDRQQDQQQAGGDVQATTASLPDGNVVQESRTNFPQNMLAAIVAAREREVTERSLEHGEPRFIPPILSAERGERYAPRHEPAVDTEQWWHQDAEHIIRALTSDDALRDEVGMTSREASVLLAYFIDNTLQEPDRLTIDGLMRNPTVIWRTGLPSEWLKRRRDAHPEQEFMYFTGTGSTSPDWAGHYNPYLKLEVIAQAFQMSASIRSRAQSLTPPQRLQMLYRLQAGRRDDCDVHVLTEMRSDDVIFGQAENTYRSRLDPSVQEFESSRIAAIVEHDRQEMARNGDHSRRELDSRRRDTTQAFALAAGRQAMQEGSQALYERLADHDEGTRAAWQRLESNGFLGSSRAQLVISRRARLLTNDLSDSESDSDSDSEAETRESEARGLDALDTGRPEPKPDEELTLQMACNICYTQLADIACLPCGHLVMCKWCSEQHSPTMQHDRTRPRRAAACPVCRKGVRQKVRVYRA